MESMDNREALKFILGEIHEKIVTQKLSGSREEPYSVGYMCDHTGLPLGNLLKLIYPLRTLMILDFIDIHDEPETSMIFPSITFEIRAAQFTIDEFYNLVLDNCKKGFLIASVTNIRPVETSHKQALHTLRKLLEIEETVDEA